jgi:hypothetical protein
VWLGAVPVHRYWDVLKGLGLGMLLPLCMGALG